jgi:sporulation protein YlmC with PRC-barrel domain
MEISIQTEVRCADGPVGKSTHIIVDLVTEQVTHIVVKTTPHGGEYLVPLDLVRSADREAIQLNCSKDEIGDLTPFKESYFHGPDAYGGTPPIPSADIAPSYTLYHPSSYTLYHPYRTAETEAEEATVHPSTEQLAINKGAVVLATDGQVGVVDELVIEPKTHRITHLVLREHELLKTIAVTVPVKEIERVEVDTVFLKIDIKAVASLPTVTLKKYPWE